MFLWDREQDPDDEWNYPEAKQFEVLIVAEDNRSAGVH